MLDPQYEAHAKKRLQSDQVLLHSLKVNLTELEGLLIQFADMYEDGIYRFYHQSFKVYQLQFLTSQASDVFENIAKAADTRLCDSFKQIVAAGTGAEWEIDHNHQWLLHTRPIVEAFLHAKYFLEMMVRFATKMDSAPTTLPFGWAAILELYNQR